jgi:hypothetical protein
VVVSAGIVMRVESVWRYSRCLVWVGFLQFIVRSVWTGDECSNQVPEEGSCLGLETADVVAYV